MKHYQVWLFRSPDCIRGWLAYLRPGVDTSRATVLISVDAESGPKAKNKAITAANNEFKGVHIIGFNRTDNLWGADNFPELKKHLAIG